MSGLDKPDRFSALVHPGGTPHEPGVFVDDDAPLPVSIVAGTGFPPAMVGYPEDSPHVSGDRGLFILAVRNDTPGSLTDTDGDYAPVQVNAAGELRVTTAGGGGTSGTAQPDKSTFTEGSSLFTPVGGVFNESIIADPTEDQSAAARITAKRAIHINPRNTAGTEIGTASDPIRIDPTGSTTQPVSGTVTVASITAALPTGDNTIGRIKITDGIFTASVRDTGSSDSLNVAIVDGSGNQITSFGGGVQYTELDTDSSITGTAIMWEDAGDTLRPVSAAKPLPVSGTLAVTQSGAWTVTANAGTGTFAVDQVDTASLDYDTGAGTVNQTVIGIALPGAGGPVAGGTATNPVRTDPTGSTTQPVSGTVTVASITAALPSGDNTIGRVKITDGTTVASVRDFTNANPLDVAIVDAAGDQITNFTGGVQYTEGDTDTTITGTAILWEDTGDQLRPVSAVKPLPVNVVSGGGGGMTDDSPFTPASSTVSPMGAFCDETATDSVDEGDIGAVRMAADRILLQDLRRITNTVSTNNTSALVLAGAATFTGTADDVTNFGAITLTIRASHSSAAEGISVEWSSDGGTNWDRTELYTYISTKPFSILLRPKGTHYRVRYTNGATLQTSFRLKSIYHVIAPTSDQEQFNGRIVIDGLSYPLKWAAINATLNGDNTVLTAVAAKKLRIIGITFLSDKNVEISFKSGTNVLIQPMSFAARGGMTVNDQPAAYWLETNAGEAFIINCSVNAANVRGRLSYVEL